MKEFWCYLYEDCTVHPMGLYDIATEFDDMYDKAVEIGEAHDEEPMLPLHEDDLTEIGAALQDMTNTGNGLKDHDWLHVGTIVEAHEIAALYKLARKHRDMQFLQTLLFDTQHARKLWKGARK